MPALGIRRPPATTPAPPVSISISGGGGLHLHQRRRPPKPYSAAALRFHYSAAAMDQASAMEDGAVREAMALAPPGRDLALPALCCAPEPLCCVVRFCCAPDSDLRSNDSNGFALLNSSFWDVQMCSECSVQNVQCAMFRARMSSAKCSEPICSVLINH